MQSKLAKFALLLIAAVMLVSIAFAGAASAATHEVGNATDLTDAFSKAQAGDTIKLTASFPMNKVITVSKQLTLDLNGKTLTANESDYHFKVLGNFTVTDSLGGGSLCGNGTASNAMAGSVLVGDNSYFNLINATIANCKCNFQDSQSAGGVRVNGGATFTMVNSSIINCHYTGTSSYAGGIIVRGGGKVNMIDSIIANCSGPGGGGINLINKDLYVSLERSSIINCSGSTGGGIRGSTISSGYAYLVLSNSTITECTTDVYGGGINAGYTKINISGNSMVTGNKNSGGSEENIYIVNYAEKVNLVGKLTGKIGISMLDSPSSGTEFGTAEDGATGAENFISDDNASLVGSLKGTKLVWAEPPTYVAEIVENGTQYTSVSDAFNATNATYKTIRLLNDSTLTDQITVNKEVILNLSGYNLTAALNQRLFYVSSGGNLTLMSSDGEGKLMGNGTVSWDGGGVYVSNGGAFNMNGGTIDNCRFGFN